MHFDANGKSQSIHLSAVEHGAVMSWCHICYITSVILYIYSGYVTASEYYVSAAPNGEDCLNDLPCHNLSYYTADFGSYFTDDTIFYFLEGTHTLQGILNISNVSNITLQGLGHIQQGFHETVMQSTSVITCRDSEKNGIQFTSSSDVVLKSLTIANCGFNWHQYYSVSLYFVNINTVTLEWVSVQNSSGDGLALYNAYDVLIANSSFANNGEFFRTLVGNVYIKYHDHINRQLRVIILKSNFTLGLGHAMHLWCDNDNEADVMIENSVFSHNIAKYGGGMYIVLHGGGSIEISDCTLHKNTAEYGGGGMYIRLYGNSSIDLNNCTLYNNTAPIGGGMYISSDENGSIDLENCTLHNNTGSFGGSMYIQSYGNASIDLENCTLHNNTGYIGGSMYIQSYGNGSIDLDNCTLYNNTAAIGGGMYINSYDNSSIESDNCTLYNNTAQYGGGGVYISSDGNSSIDLNNCTQYNNAAPFGGGVYINSHGNSSIDLDNCTLYNNSALYGGGMYISSYGDTSIDLDNCILYNNSALYGGGMYISSYGDTSIDLDNCILYNNTAQYGGGGMYISSYGDTSIDLDNCILHNNTAQYGGGGMYISSSGNSSIDLDNCTLYINNAQYGGGGMYISSYGNSSIDLDNCTLYNNNAQYGGGVNITLYGNGSIDLGNCTLYNNTAQYGGGMYVSSYGNSSIDLDNCTLYINNAQYGGGGMYISSDKNGSIDLENCTLYNNTAQYGGGMYIRSYWNGSVDLDNCTLYNNNAQYGGGMYVSSYKNGSIDLGKCILYNNTAQYEGGSMYVSSYGNSSIDIDDCTLYNNNAPFGGGMHISSDKNGSIDLENCTLYNNTAQYEGGGMYISSDENSSIDLDNCTLYNNTAQYGGGGGMYISSYGNGSIDLGNCILYNNTAQYGGGVDISSHRNGSIDLDNCILYNNTAQYGGGVDISSHRNGSIDLDNCTLYNNTAQYGGGMYVSSYENGSIDLGNCTLCNNTAPIGGGVYLSSYGNSSIDLDICTLYSNTAQNGGGLYIRSDGNSSIHLSNCIIYNNTAQVFGGGMRMYSLGCHNIEFINCTIYYNTAKYYGGGMYISSSAESGSVVFSNCIISNNSAHFASGLALRSVQANSTLTSGFHFVNVSFHFNKVINNPNVLQKRYRSAVVLVNVGNVTFDHIEVSKNNATGLVGEYSLITFDRQNMFVNNSGIYGGGIALYKSSQLLLNQKTNISFVNNYASKSGGGIFVYHDQVLGEDIATDCFFKVIPYHFPNDTKTVLYFVNNTANISGDVLYGGKIDNCTNTLYFDHLFHYPQQTGLSVVSSNPIQVCFCEGNRQNCSITNVSMLITPGFDVNVSLATVGILDGLTQGVIKLNSSDNSSIVQYHNNRLNAVCTNVTFTLRIHPSLNTTQVYATLNNSISEPLYDPYAKVIEVAIESCPIGFQLVNGICICRPEFNLPSITCDVITQIITRDGDIWIGYENDSNCLIVYSNCPFHYCNDSNISFTLNYSSKQCLHNRSGILCGECSQGFGLMLGYNQCGECTNDHIALIIPFALAGIALVSFIIFLNLTVSVGTINGLIFYANVVKIYEPIFFHKHTVNFLSQIISWINLDLGIKTCFYHNMNSCSKMWLQFVFPAYVWIIIIFIIILLRYSSKAVRLVGRQAIPVLATMILLSYTKLIRTVFQVLYSTDIPCTDVKNNTITLQRWYIDANVQFLRDCHLPLFLFSLAVLILLIVPYTFFLLTIPLFEGPLSKYMCCCKTFSTYTKPFFDAYGGPYKDNRRFWTGFLLLVRVILALVISLDIEPSKSLDVLTSLLIVIMFMHYIFKGIYRHFPLDYLEEFFILNLMFMAYMNVQTSNDIDDSKGQVSSIVLVSISLVVFCGIILYHVWDHLIKSCLQQPISKVKKIFKKPPPSSSSNDLQTSLMRSRSTLHENKFTMSVVTVEMTRESMLFDTDD